MALGMEAGLSPGHIVLDGGPAPSPKRGQSPQMFGSFLLRPNGWMHQDAPWYGGRPPPRGLCVRWRASPLSKMGAEPPPPKFSAHVYCGQTTGWIKMPLGTKLGPSPAHSMLDGDLAHPFPKKGTEPGCGDSNFGPCLLWLNGWMDQDGTRHGGRPWFIPHCARWGHSPPIFGPSL